MRKIITIALITAVLCVFGASAASAQVQSMMLEYDGGTHEYNGEVYSLVVNNQILDPPLSPIIFNDRALVPVREIFEEVGARVNYIGETQTVEVIGDNTNVSLRINDNVAYINGNRTNIPDNVVPKLISKVGGETKTMVPVRFISENIGLDVDFDSDDGAILIDSDGYRLAENYDAEDEVVPEEPVYTAPEVYITDVACEVLSRTEARITVTADNDIESYTDFVLKSPERLVVDIPQAHLGGAAENTEIDDAGISSIRLGDNAERARIVVDLSGLKKYNVTLAEPNVIEISTTIKRQTQQTPSDTSAEPQSIASAKIYSAQSADTKLIVLDAGHGGSDSGAVGYLDGEAVLEKNLTLEITNRVKDILEGAGYTVSLTRDDDSLPSLTERPAQANAENAAVFVSIHINAVDNHPEASGTEVYYATENNDDGYGTTSEQLAHNILERMLKYMKSVNRGVKSAEHAVTRRCNMPAALAEVGFITNPEEVYLMTTDEYQQKAAQGIAEGIIVTLRDITVPQ